MLRRRFTQRLRAIAPIYDGVTTLGTRLRRTCPNMTDSGCDNRALCSPPQTANKKMMSTLPAIAEDAPSNDQRSAPAPTLKHTVSKGSIQEMSQHVDPRRRSRSLSDEAIQKTYEERYATKEKGD